MMSIADNPVQYGHAMPTQYRELAAKGYNAVFALKTGE